MPESRFVSFLVESFAALRREWPDIHARMCRALAPREVTVIVDGEVAPLSFGRNAVRLLGRPRRPAIEVHTSRVAILALVEARCTLAEAILDDRLLLKGSPADLLCFHDALITYLHGAVRGPSFPQLLRRFRAPAKAR